MKAEKYKRIASSIGSPSVKKHSIIAFVKIVPNKIYNLLKSEQFTHQVMSSSAKLPTRRLGRDGPEVSAIGFGVMGLGGAGYGPAG